METPLVFLKRELTTLQFCSSGRSSSRITKEAKKLIPEYEKAIADLERTTLPVEPAEVSEEIEMETKCPKCQENIKIKFTNQLPQVSQNTESAEEYVDKTKTPLSIFTLKRFFQTEVDLNFCSKEYFERIGWYLDTYFRDAQSHQVSQVTDEDIEICFPCEVGQSVIMEKDMSYDDVRKANYFRRQGAKAHRDGKIPTSDKGEKEDCICHCPDSLRSMDRNGNCRSCGGEI